MEWVKKQRANGSIYYFNVLTGTKQARSPNDLDGTDGGPAPSHGGAVHHLFRVRERKYLYTREYESSIVAYSVGFLSDVIASKT